MSEIWAVFLEESAHTGSVVLLDLDVVSVSNLLVVLHSELRGSDWVIMSTSGVKFMRDELCISKRVCLVYLCIGFALQLRR